MATYVNTLLPKICHAKPGAIIRLADTETGEVLPELFVLSAVDLDKPSTRRKPPYPASAGLFNEERQLLLVSLTTGRARKMPHPSTHVDITRLKLDDVLPEAATAPVLVSTSEEAQVRVMLATGTGRVERYVNLAIPSDTMGLLKSLAETADHVTEVKTVREIKEEEAKDSWRKAVAAGETLLSFDEFKLAVPA
ncbi:hypothetical protein AB4Y45_35545 [Paraburkholderia sp. EG287A]|uniref:hypothetical protein n=1 Tax=Paraburkholderia sp. EG287A TaxID=3237012 RepID=UPI0034D3108A